MSRRPPRQRPRKLSVADCRAYREYKEDILITRGVTNCEIGSRRPELRWLSVWSETKAGECPRGACVKYLVQIHHIRQSQFRIKVGPFTLVARVHWVKVFERDQNPLVGYRVGAHYTARVLLHADVLFDSEPRWSNLQVKNPNFNPQPGCVCKGCYSTPPTPPTCYCRQCW